MVYKWEDEPSYDHDTPWGIPNKLSMTEIAKEFGVPAQPNDTLLDTKMVLISHAKALYAQ